MSTLQALYPYLFYNLQQVADESSDPIHKRGTNSEVPWLTSHDLCEFSPAFSIHKHLYF